MRPGDQVPDFEARDQTGAAVRLSELTADGPVVLFFYPRAMTRGCTAESCHFRDLAGDFRAVGARAVGISADSVERQARFDEENDLGLPLLSDPDRRIAATFGVKRPGPLFNRRMTFRVSPDPEEVIAVSASWKNGACRGELLNISTSGMALRVDAEAVACLGGQRKIELDFNLPGADPALCLPGTIAYIKALPKGHRIGIKFNYARKLGFHPQEAAIARYVMAQQQKALQRPSPSR